MRPIGVPLNGVLIMAMLQGVFGCAGGSPSERVYRLAEMNTDQIRALDRDRTVIVVPGGIMEEHGPYLPSYSDGYQNERYTADLASAIARRPGWTAVVFPMIPLGSGGANAVSGKLQFPGTFAVRPETLRSVFMDLGDEFGEQGFRGSSSFTCTAGRNTTRPSTRPASISGTPTTGAWSTWPAF